MKVAKPKTVTKAKPKAPAVAASKLKKAKPAPVASKPVSAVSKKEKAGLNLAEIKAKAKALGVTADKLEKAELILAIQRAEKNTPCFGTGTLACPHFVCCWRVDCII
ncbi:MAG: hypothetical protein WCI03_08030 [bacterium]|jgi:hypothetical protein